jgi:hypothetical protein
MKSLLFIFLFISLNLFSQNKVFYINGYRFDFKEEIVDSDRKISIYRNGKYLFGHYIEREDGDCNNAYYLEGSYSVDGNIFTFNTYYHQTGNDPIPKQRYQKYSVNSNGTVILITDKELYPYGWVNSTFEW